MDAVKVVRIALSVLSERLLVLLALMLGCFLASWVMYEPSWERVSVLGIFTLFAYVLLYQREGKRNENP